MNGAVRPPVQAFIGLGANLGDAEAALQAALGALARLPKSRVSATSSIYRSAPVDATGPDFLNAVVRLETSLTASALLATLHDIERAYGRERPFRNAPRTLDLDLLLYGALRVDTPDLSVPHPRITERAFVLMPLAEIDPALKIPGHGAVADLTARLAHQRIDKLSGRESGT